VTGARSAKVKPMSTTAELLADHGARMTVLEREQQSISQKIDRLLFWIMGTMAASIGGLLATVAGLLKH
jgi:hypothetical protein